MSKSDAPNPFADVPIRSVEDEGNPYLEGTSEHKLWNALYGPLDDVPPMGDLDLQREDEAERFDGMGDGTVEILSPEEYEAFMTDGIPQERK